MTDHLIEARADLDRLEACNHGSWLASAVAHILDHLEEQQIDPQQLAASIRRGLDDVAAGRTEHLGRFADDEPDPLDEDNHTDRIDRDGYRWVWCVGCDGLRIDGHEAHKSSYGRSAYGVNEDYGPLTFAQRPASAPTACPQSEQAHGDAPDPARPAETHTDNIRAEAWDEGWCTGYADGAHHPHITPNPYRKDRA